MFRERIKQAYESLTPSFKRLGEFILNNELDVAFMTATELAQALGVDAATVVRFSQTLGYEGYRELSHELQQVVKANLTAKYANFDQAKSNEDKIRALLENERHNLETAVSQVTDDASKLLNAISKAKRVWLVGEAGALYLAAYFADYLRMAGVNAAIVDADPAAAARVLWDLSAKDVVIGLGIPGTGLDTAATLRFAKEKGAETAALTVSSVSPPAQIADLVLVCAANSPVGVPSAASIAVMMAVLWQALLSRKGEAMAQHMAALQETYAGLLAARVEQSKQSDIHQLWREF